jgi:uncharacterized membrane protein
MTVEVGAMLGAGVAALVAGLALARERLRAAQGVERVLLLGPVFEAVSLAVFAAEHFSAARDLMGIVPRWLPWHLFWTYFVGAAWLASAVSFITWRQVRWSAGLTALLFLIIVATVSLPGLPKHAHERLFWTLCLRETAFAGGAMVLAGSTWPRANRAASALLRVGRGIVGATMIFYALEHFLYPKHVPGVPLEKLTPGWAPALALAYAVGISLLVGGVGLFYSRMYRVAAAACGVVLVLLTALFYVPIFVMEMHSELALEGLNYVGDTLLFAATVLLAGWGGGPGVEGQRGKGVKEVQRRGRVGSSHR